MIRGDLEKLEHSLQVTSKKDGVDTVETKSGIEQAPSKASNSSNLHGDLQRLEEALSRSESEELGRRYVEVKELLQKPYGRLELGGGGGPGNVIGGGGNSATVEQEEGVPDAATLGSILAMPREDFLMKVGLTGSGVPAAGPGGV